MGTFLAKRCGPVGFKAPLAETSNTIRVRRHLEGGALAPFVRCGLRHAVLAGHILPSGVDARAQVARGVRQGDVVVLARSCLLETGQLPAATDHVQRATGVERALAPVRGMFVRRIDARRIFSPFLAAAGEGLTPSAKYHRYRSSRRVYPSPANNSQFSTKSIHGLLKSESGASVVEGTVSPQVPKESGSVCRPRSQHG